MGLDFDFVCAFEQSAVLFPFHCFKTTLSGPYCGSANNVQKALRAIVLRIDCLVFLPP